jgi:hypothetical protein
MVINVTTQPIARQKLPFIFDPPSEEPAYSRHSTDGPFGIPRSSGNKVWLAGLSPCGIENMPCKTPATPDTSTVESATANRVHPQFGLKAIFGFTAWTAAVAGLGVSQFRGWTMYAVGLSVVCLNCSGRLSACQRQPAQTRFFQAAWLLLFVSLFLPAMKGCNNTSIRGWEAAKVCALVTVDPVAKTPSEWTGHVLFCLCNAVNVLLVLSPLFLWRLRRGKGAYYGLLMVAAVPAMWCFGDPAQMLIGYYVWCAAALAILCAYPMRWAMLPLLAIAPILTWFAPQGSSSSAAGRPTPVSATTTRSAS